MEILKPIKAFRDYINTPESKAALTSALNPKPQVIEIPNKNTHPKKDPIKKENNFIYKLDKIITEGQQVWLDMLYGENSDKTASDKFQDNPRK